jgi:hypothetical protein
MKCNFQRVVFTVSAFVLVLVGALWTRFNYKHFESEAAKLQGTPNDQRASPQESLLALSESESGPAGLFMELAISLDKLKTLPPFRATVERLTNDPVERWVTYPVPKALSYLGATMSVAGPDTNSALLGLDYEIFLVTDRGQSFVVHEVNPGSYFMSLFKSLEVGNSYQFPDILSTARSSKESLKLNSRRQP